MECVRVTGDSSDALVRKYFHRLRDGKQLEKAGLPTTPPLGVTPSCAVLGSSAVYFSTYSLTGQRPRLQVEYRGMIYQADRSLSRREMFRAFDKYLYAILSGRIK